MVQPVQASGAERRQHQREKVFEIVALYVDGKVAPCVVDDLSLSGALVTCELKLSVGQPVEFEIDEFGKIPGNIAHVRGTMAGIKFAMDESLELAYADWFAQVEKED
jgi:hypothetical protein